MWKATSKLLLSSVLSLLLTGCDPNGGFGDLVGSNSSDCSPTVLAVSPYVISPSGGTPFSVIGSCFKTGLKIYIQGSEASSVVYVSGNSATGIAPASSAYGAATVVVLNSDNGSGNLPNGAYYQGPPTISSVTPSAGSLAGGNTVTILGSGFLAGATVRFGSASAQLMSVLSSAQGSVTVPAGSAGSVDVIVSNPDGQSATLTNGYTFQAAPVVTTISPTSGSNTGGTLVTIFGANFRTGATVMVGSNSCSGVGVAGNGLSLTCTTSPGVSGAVDVRVTNSDSQYSTLSAAYTYTGASAAPTLVSVSPNAGSATGGTTIVITGTNFVTGASVSIGGTTAAVSTLSSTNITAVTTAKAAGTYSLTVTNPDTQSATLGAAYTYNNPPVLASVAPTGGPLAGGNTITLSGSNFSPLAVISVGAGSCTSVLANSTTATCTAPAGSSGAKNVTITNPDGTSSTLTSSYTYNPAPTVSSIAPSAGKVTSGTLATITGTNFQAGATVTVGGTSATVTSSSATSLFVTLPAHSAGATDVVVTNPDSQSSTLTNGYTFQPAPVVGSISPATGALGGGTAVTITGSGFLSGASVTIGSSALSGTTVVSSTSITGFTTSATAGAKDVVVTNSDGQVGTLTNGYTYSAGPTATSSSPAAGAVAGGTTVTVTGTGFASPMTVSVNGNAGTSVNVVSATSLTFHTPANTAGTYSIVVTDAFSQSATLSNAFTYNPAPTVTSISPGAGPLAGGTAVTITGTGFLASASVSVGGVPLSVSSIGSTTIVGTTGANSVGNYSTVVTNSDGQSGTGGTFGYRPAPTVTAVSPTSGSTTGGTTVTITGTNFYSGLTATVGGVTCTSPTYVSSTSMTCVTGFHAAGVTDIVILNTPDNQSGTGTNLFTYRSPPSLVSVTASSGFIGGGNSVTLGGTGFAAGATVTFGGVAATNVVVVSSSSITCTTPAAASAGAKDVVVTNTDSQASTLTNGFTYQVDNFTVVDQYLGNPSPIGYFDGTGSDVRFNGPYGVAADGAGNAYAIEFTNCTIRKITSGGVVTTIAGTAGTCTMVDGPGANARFRSPAAAVIDPTGNTMYVGEWGAVRSVSLTSPYTVATLAGSGSAQAATDGTGAAARFQNIRGIAIDPTGTYLYVADQSNHRIRQITVSSGAVLTIAGSGTAGTLDNATGTSARFNTPRGVAVVGGDLYVSDGANHTLRMVSLTPPYATSTVVGVAGANAGTDGTGTSARLYTPIAMYYDGSSNLYIGDGNSGTVRQVTVPGLVVTTLWGTYNTTGSSDDVYNSARFNQVTNISGDSTYLYVADYGNHLIRRIKFSDGSVTAMAGVPNSYGYTDGTQAAAKFNGPRGMNVVGGTLYMTEWNNCLIRTTILSTIMSGTFAGLAATCSAQDGVGTFSARFNRTGFMTNDGTNFFIADTNSHTVRRVSIASASTNTLAGSSGLAGNATGTGTTARFNTPLGIAVYGTDIYVADSLNHVIRKVTSTSSSTNGGVVSTFSGTAGTSGWVDGAAGSARFNTPSGIVILGSTMYVADYANCVIRTVDMTSGDAATIAGTQGSCSYADGTGTSARFNNPYGITTDGTNLYVSDFTNHAVRKVSMPGAVVTTLFGDPTTGLDNTGGALGVSQIRSPTGILWDTNGLFISNDYGVKRVH